MYLHEHKNWTAFKWDEAAILPLLSKVRFEQGLLVGKMRNLGFALEAETELDVLMNEIIASSQIEGITLDTKKVRSSVSRQLGLELPRASIDTRDVDGAVDIMFDATRNFDAPLSNDRLHGWHAALFPTGYSGLHKVHVTQYRNQEMRVVSGAIGKEKTHFVAPEPEQVKELMDNFILWFNSEENMEPLIKAGLAHVWFLTIHPFDDGNGRIARALTELLLARADRSPRRFYSMASQILATREKYYSILEQTQKGNGNVTSWLVWFLKALQESIGQSNKNLQIVLNRSVFWRKLEGASLNERQRTMINRLRDNFEGKLTASKWAKICKVSPDTALRDIKDLIDKGILRQDSAGGRSTSYLLNTR